MRKVEDVRQDSSIAGLRMEARVRFPIGRPNAKSRTRPLRLWRGNCKGGGLRGLAHRAAQ